MDYMPEVIQVIPTDEFKVYVYFDDGSIKLYDASEDIKLASSVMLPSQRGQTLVQNYQVQVQFTKYKHFTKFKCLVECFFY